MEECCEEKILFNFYSRFIKQFINNLDDLNNSQKIKMLQLALQYTLPKLQTTVLNNHKEDLPIFLD